MQELAKDVAETSPLLTVSRTDLAAFLLAFLRAGDAKAASLNSDDITLDLLSKTLSIAFGKIETVELKVPWGGL